LRIIELGFKPPRWFSLFEDHHLRKSQRNSFYSYSLPVLLLISFGLTAFKPISGLFKSHFTEGTVAASLEISLSSNVASIETSETFIYTIQYRCASITEDCIGAYITDQLPSSLRYVGVVNSSHVANSNYDEPSKTVTFNFVDPLPAGSTGSLEIFAEFIGGYTANGTVATNTATFSASNALPETTLPVNVTAIATAQTLFEKYRSAGGAVGGQLSYSFQICNQNANKVDNGGTLNLENMSIVDPLPAGTSLVQVRNYYTTNSYDAVSNTVTWTLTKNLVPGECIYPKVTIDVPAAAYPFGSSIVNNAEVFFTPVGESPTSEIVSASHTMTNPTYEAYTTKVVDGVNKYPSNSGTYSIDLEFEGTEALTNFCIVDNIPADIEVKSIKHGGYAYGGLSGPENIINISYTTNLNGSTLIAGSPFSRYETGSIDVVSDLGLTL